MAHQNLKFNDDEVQMLKLAVAKHAKSLEPGCEDSELFSHLHANICIQEDLYTQDPLEMLFNVFVMFEAAAKANNLLENFVYEADNIGQYLVRNGVLSVNYFKDMDTLEKMHLTAIKDELRAGRKIEAIKLHRQQTGVGLKESKEYVEAIIQAQIFYGELP